MATAAKNFDSANSAITSTLNTLMSQLTMLNGSWKGLAATEFENVKNRYQKDLTDLNQALAETAEAIRASGVGYSTSDTDAASRVTKSGGGGYTLPL